MDENLPARRRRMLPQPPVFPKLEAQRARLALQGAANRRRLLGYLFTKSAFAGHEIVDDIATLFDRLHERDFHWARYDNLDSEPALSVICLGVCSSLAAMLTGTDPAECMPWVHDLDVALFGSAAAAQVVAEEYFRDTIPTNWSSMYAQAESIGHEAAVELLVLERARANVRRRRLSDRFGG